MSPEDFFRQCETLHAQTGVTTRAIYDFAGHAVCLETAGHDLAALLERAFIAPSAPSRLPVEPSLTIKAWDATASGIALPPAPWSPEAHGPHGAIRGYNDGRFRTAWLDGAAMLVLFDCQRGLGIVVARDARHLPWYERAAPLRLLMHWWAASRGFLLTHAAAVGTSSAGYLIIGPGGSGKSTVALSTLGSALRYGGDDYVLVEFEPEPRAVSLYATAKVAPDHLRRFAHLSDLAEGEDCSAGPKTVLFLRAAQPQALIPAVPIRAIIMPRVVGTGPNRLVPMGRAAALRAVAPSTLFQVPDGDSMAFARLAKLVASVPSYELQLGEDCSAIPDTLGSLNEDAGAAASDVSVANR